jgi:hypothetical protein
MATRKFTCTGPTQAPRSNSPGLRAALDKLADAQALILTATEALEATELHAHHGVVLRNGLQLLQYAYNGLDAAIREGT